VDCITKLRELLDKAKLKYIHYFPPFVTKDWIVLIDDDKEFVDSAFCCSDSNTLKALKLNNCKTPEEVAEGWIKIIKERGVNRSK